MKIGFLLDIDGVIYRGSETIPGAGEFVKMLLAKDIPFLFLTNNSRGTALDVATRLRRMGLSVSTDHVFTSAMATAEFVASQKSDGTAYVIGEGGLLHALHSVGYAIVDRNPDYVVIGEGRVITMEMIDSAVSMILSGAKLIATNLDANCPTQDGKTRVGCGSLVAMLERATGATSFSVGKPNPIMLRIARKKLGLRTHQTFMVGDTMETDILGGLQMGYRTILVLSGGTRREDLANYAYQPDLVID